MLLALDIGNTNITLGAFSDDELRATGRIATDTSRMSDEYGLLLNQLLPLRGVTPGEVKSVVMCSVVPPLTPTFVELSKTFFGVTPLVVGAGTKTGIKILYDNPRDVGADRITDAAAALKTYGGPVIIVDIGTATVFDAVTKNGEYLGGAIAPGMAIAADALFHSTSQLRRVELTRPNTAIGKNTVHAMQSGLVLGYSDLINGMVARFDQELGGGSKVIATGGLASVIAEEVSIFDAVDPYLTLTGLRLIHELNTN
jgi:type III pantothenate kinase